MYYYYFFFNSRSFPHAVMHAPEQLARACHILLAHQAYDDGFTLMFRSSMMQNLLIVGASQRTSQIYVSPMPCNALLVQLDRYAEAAMLDFSILRMI